MEVVKAVTTKAKGKVKTITKETKDKLTKEEVKTSPSEEVKQKAAPNRKNKVTKPEDYTGIEFYCVKCKAKGKCKDIVLEKDKKDKSRLKGACLSCDTKLYRYYSVA